MVQSFFVVFDLQGLSKKLISHLDVTYQSLSSLLTENWNQWLKTFSCYVNIIQ